MPEKPFMAEGPAATRAYVVLVVENELLERVSTATHLRKSGFDVIEAADGDVARRALNSVPVNVVFADLAMPGQTNGLALLRWLRERHPFFSASPIGWSISTTASRKSWPPRTFAAMKRVGP
jgi:CheY-like chemotaxis protein